MKEPDCSLFHRCRICEYDFYWIVYALLPVNREKREKLKSSGWKLQRHSRTNEEIWIFDK